jgi:hypothetical protein
MRANPRLGNLWTLVDMWLSYAVGAEPGAVLIPNSKQELFIGAGEAITGATNLSQHRYAWESWAPQAEPPAGAPLPDVVPGMVTFSPAALIIILVCLSGLCLGAGAVAQICIAARSDEKYPSSKGAKSTAPQGSFTLGQMLLMALVPSTVPGSAHLLALTLALLFGKLAGNLNGICEQVAGGALLITYIKELFPKVMRQCNLAIKEQARLGGGATGTALSFIRVWCTLLMVGSIASSIIMQTAFAGFPGILPDDQVDTKPEAGASNGGVKEFKPADTIPYFIGFFVDGIVLAYCETPVRCNAALLRTLLIR